MGLNVNYGVSNGSDILPSIMDLAKPIEILDRKPTYGNLACLEQNTTKQACMSSIHIWGKLGGQWDDG